MGHWLLQRRGHKAKGSPSGQTVTQGAESKCEKALWVSGPQMGW